MNPNSKPVTPQTSKSAERDLMRFLMVYQAAVEEDEHSNRFATRDHAIIPIGTDIAAEKTGRTMKYIQNTLNPFNETNPPGLREFYRLWRSADLDVSVIAELLRPRRMVAFQLPVIDDKDDAAMAIHAVELAKEVGDVFCYMEEVFRVSSELGKDVSRNELDRFSRECYEVMPKLLVLIEDMKARAASCR